MSTPQSTLHICSGVRLDNRYEHTIFFEDSAAQLEYFAGKVVRTFSACSYLRKSWPVQVMATMEEAKRWSYLYFRNAASGKWYYYFITQVEYKNDSMVELTLELDVMQTYMFDYTRLPCFVERNHTKTDAVGEHTMEEGLELGELVTTHKSDWEDLEELCILVLSSIDPNYHDTEEPVPALGNSYNGVFCGIMVYAVNGEKWSEWSAQMRRLNTAGFLEGIMSMWIYPKALVTLFDYAAIGFPDVDNDWDGETIALMVDGSPVSGINKTITAPTEVDGYTPRNKKLLTYPYSMLYVTNNAGGSAIYRWERFSGDANFTAFGTLSPDGGIKMVPRGYNGLTTDDDDTSICFEEGLALGGYPVCAWNNDVYKMWLAQNQHQLTHSTAMIEASMVGSAVTAVGGLATGNLIMAAGGAAGFVSGLQQITGQMARKADMAIQPPQARGSFSSNVNMTAGKQTYTFYKKTVSAEYARAIDDFFTMYGYKINRVQTPGIYNRSAFTYVKTVGCAIEGNMCVEDITKIESIYDRGITFWVDGDKIGAYGQTNTPIGET